MATKIPDRDAQNKPLHRASGTKLRSEVMSDEWTGYIGLDADYIHRVINHSKKYAEGRIHTNGIENFWTLFKRCIKGTYVSVECDHLSAYLLLHQK